MWTQFILENFHFAAYQIGALIFFIVSWLYFDAWTASKNKAGMFKALGFLVLAVSFVFQAVSFTFPLVKILGFVLLIIGLLLDPIQAHPSEKMALVIPTFLLPFSNLEFLFPILAGYVALLYLKRATIGLENHLMKVSIAFFVLALSETLSLATFFSGSTNVAIYNLVAKFGIIWVIAHLLFLIAVYLLARWSFSYLFKRFSTQIFIIMNLCILIIFLVTTVSFTFLLIRNIRDETLTRLGTDVKVLYFGIDSKKHETLSAASLLSNDKRMKELITDSTKRFELANYLSNFLLSKNESFVLVTDNQGKVLARGDDFEKYGESLSDDPLVKRSLKGESVSAVSLKSGLLSPLVYISSSVPVKDESDAIVAVAVIGTVLDNAFVDGIKSVTGLEASIYANDKLSATTLTSFGESKRPIGIKEEDNKIVLEVLNKGESYVGETKIQNTTYFGSYYPLKDIDEIPVGMLFVGKTQISTLEAAAKSIDLTFILTAILIVISIIPTFVIARYLSNQLK